MNSGAKFIFACILVICAFSCKEKDDDPEKSNYIQAKVNGVLWNPSSVKCSLLIDTSLDFRLVNFSASSSGKAITIEAFDNATGGNMNTGTRTFSAGNAYFGYNTSGIPYHAISGAINIESVEASSQLVTGSFEFVAEDNSGNQIQVSEGRFVKVPYTVKIQ